eukprot:9542995-Alexandrium_andersonii.AAC.1
MAWSLRPKRVWCWARALAPRADRPLSVRETAMIPSSGSPRGLPPFRALFASKRPLPPPPLRPGARGGC